MKIIGLGHRRFVGKDTIADFMVSHLRATKRGMLIVKAGFATKMKSIANELYSWAGLHDEDYYEHNQTMKEVKLPLINKSPREIWIELGTTIGRAIYPDTWLKHLLNRKAVDYLIVKDVRFPNEADEILAKDGLVFRVDNPRVPKSDDVADSALANYQNWSGVIVNDSDLVTLNKKVITLLETL